MQPKSSAINKWIKNIHPEYYSPRKKGNFAACDIDSPGEHYAERNKSDTERQILYRYFYIHIVYCTYCIHMV